MTRYGNNARGVRQMIEDDRREAHAESMEITKKSAECAHCGKRIVWNVATHAWEHRPAVTGLKPCACYVLGNYILDSLGGMSG